MTDEPIRLLLVDDQDLVRVGLRRILRRRDGFEVVGECADGDEVPAAVAESRPDVVLMDLRMKRVSGMEATRRLGERTDAPPVLVLTTFRDDDLLSAALRAGVAGFVLKDSPAEELIRAVRLVAAGEAVLDPAVTGRVLQTYRAARQPATTRAGAVDPLTAREVDVLGLVGRGLSNDDIAAELVISIVTVKSHIGSIFTKLGVRNRAEAIVWAFDNGVVAPRA
ncbi:Two component transcriptional regulator, LuxR family OS=Tsukamurella paurometabola (strain ATCC 8368/ DSM / CCUG 35730 / CIP 100753 / JCM 10117 / KCTC 9821 / NBRC 16120 / NCIMB 702349 / NCTC 13040) OX=521096 GN=Tpau_1410 PE=4 SV=1 [Tsukamurella paurometabola]|uniref:Two component transcriptional regulator, LuxR family n=1 Tax=Tsukamurella paurometabola (strain ATCC 8368 / DSM 20162 / CCUG 35730 / CIP 100753 / JCM 10117 / KCTC 9821 / NBRC 16120 / NCIMB 702349 / NCTC 13040) TaxID=521096 RepID=D5UXE6_TSUPD|nr:response regulator transcription factor [Tsukamurella paurometabola]ADG78038.1 two component transcriptional regulator, LuxR family [Tsukamurella paurometabola DSM 20162]SUP29893.1 Response regulator protein vraR [Tsukamurella paurometabola]